MTPPLWLTPPQAEQIAKHAITEAPREACGIVAGVQHQARRIIPIPNSAAQPETHFELDHAAFVKALFEIESAGLTLLGFYHSHPKGNPIPSTTDITQANYPDAAYIIVGLGQKTPQIAAWQIRKSQVSRLGLHISFDRPLADTTDDLSKAQKTAIILSAVLALILMLILSISLLPPAPILTPTP
jgi:[CysO sulfur-carrier protein]-S-L-cysteine hydrolase